MRRVLVPTRIDATPALGGVVRTLAGETMGTTWNVQLVGSREFDAQPWQRGIQRVLDEVVAQMSTWDPDTDLSRFNRAAAGSSHRLPDDFFDVLSCGLQVARDSDGAYDPAAGALVNLWGFGPAPRYTDPSFMPPSPQAVTHALACSGWHRLAVNADTQEVVQPGGLQIDLSAIAKGFGVDQVVRYLQRHGIVSCLVEVGGELRGEGTKPDGQPWWVSLERPPSDGADRLPETIVALHGMSVATSGDYRRCFEANGRGYSHTLDPRDGLPIRHGLASVSVLHADCMLADAWSTALTVLGTEQGVALANAQALPALFVTRTADGFEERMSDPLAALLQ
jgi:thiamine biosynthesis lipoprotein